MIPQIKRMGIKKKVGIKIFFSFLYKAGYINNTICDIKKGNAVKNAAKSAIFKFETKTSGRAVNIILFLSESSKRLNSGLDNISPTKDAWYRKIQNETIRTKKLRSILFLNSFKWSMYFILSIFYFLVSIFNACFNIRNFIF